MRFVDLDVNIPSSLTRNNSSKYWPQFQNCRWKKLTRRHFTSKACSVLYVWF